MPSEPSESKEQPAGLNNAEALLYNDESVEMLMLLDYEQKFCSKEMKPLSRTYFVYPAANTAAQFKYFTSLVVWCLKLIQQKADWDEYDDPNTVITNMLVKMKELGVQVNAAPSKLKAGSGDGVCAVLNGLLREVLRRMNFEWGAPTWPDEGLADEADVDSDAEVQSVDEEQMANDGEEDDLMYQEDEVKKEAGNADSDDERAVLEANVDPKEWLLEVERVASKLKVTIPEDSKEWRTHLAQTRGYKQVIEAQFPPAQAQLDKLQKELSGALERIRNKESFINAQFQDRARDHFQTQAELQTVQAQHSNLNEVVMNLQIELKTIVEELETVKSEMEERSTVATDTAPVVKLKESFKKLRADTRQLEVRIGVVNHTLLQAKLRQKPSEKGKLYSGGKTNEDDYDEDEG